MYKRWRALINTFVWGISPLYFLLVCARPMVYYSIDSMSTLLVLLDKKKKPPLTFKIHSDTVYFTVQLFAISTLHFLGYFPLHHVRVPRLLRVFYDYSRILMVKLPTPPFLRCVPELSDFRESNSAVEMWWEKDIHISVPLGNHLWQCGDFGLSEWSTAISTLMYFLSDSRS